jgi:uncharacterized protein YciI
MAKSGKLVGAGPFADDGDLRGVFIFRLDSATEAKALAEADPAVKAGRLAIEMHSWMGPKGIGEPYAARIKENPNATIPMVTYQLCMLRRVSSKQGQLPLKEHFDHIQKLRTGGVLVASGPFVNSSEILGIFIFRVKSTAEAKLLAEVDPIVTSGYARVEAHPWMVADGVMP